MGITWEWVSHSHAHLYNKPRLTQHK